MNEVSKFVVDAIWKERFIILAKEHWVEAEAGFNLELGNYNSMDEYLDELIGAIDQLID